MKVKRLSFGAKQAAEKERRAFGLYLIPPVCAVVLVLICFLACTTAPSATNPTGKTKLVVFEAGSLMVPFAQIEKEFEQSNPDIDVEMQAHGSIQVIRHVTELGETVDVVAVADYSLIPMLMYQTMMPNNKPYANWYIKPAANQLVLAYTSKSKYASEINTSNWYRIITQPEVRIGLSDPRMDAVGYRTLMVTKLAESYYSTSNIMRDALGKYFTVPLVEGSENGVSTITVPELLEPSDKRMYLRGASMQLIALLESNDIDYTFEYKSVVAQHNLNYLELPPQINLSENNFAENYKKVKVKIDFRRFKSVIPEFEGLPIVYGLAIPNNTERLKEAIKFIQFVIGQTGQRIFLDCYHPPLIPPECDNIDALPTTLKPLFQ